MSHPSPYSPFVWHTPKEQYRRECLNPTVRGSGGSVMLWGHFAFWHDLGPLVPRVTANQRKVVLSDHLYPNDFFIFFLCIYLRTTCTVFLSLVLPYSFGNIEGFYEILLLSLFSTYSQSHRRIMLMQQVRRLSFIYLNQICWKCDWMMFVHLHNHVFAITMKIFEKQLWTNNLKS